MTLLPLPCCRQDPVREPFVLDEPSEHDRPNHARGESERVIVEPPGVAGRPDLPLEQVKESTRGLRERMPNGGALAPCLGSQGGEDAAVSVRRTRSAVSSAPARMAAATSSSRFLK
jgi:hypothetical protein